MKRMVPEFPRGVSVVGYGASLSVGIGAKFKRRDEVVPASSRGTDL
jgi:hypothetical protein